MPERMERKVDFEGPRIDHFWIGDEEREGRVNVRFGKRIGAAGEAVWRKEAEVMLIRGERSMVRANWWL